LCRVKVWLSFKEYGMLRKVLAASLVLVLGAGIAFADEIRAVITKVEGNKITFATRKKGQKGEEQTLTAAKDVKVVKGKFNKETKKVEAGDDIEGGLKGKAFSNIGEKGLPALIVTDGNKITEIRITPRRAKKKDQ
jgi:hypothetical protein